MKEKIILLASVLALVSVAQAQRIYFSDDFDAYATDVDVTAAGWVIQDTPQATEDSTWTITNPGNRSNPPAIDGTPTTGKFMISDSDAQSVSGPLDNGASHDLHTPSFSTLGGGTVWLHVDVSAQLNNNGACIFDVEVSTDGGSTWTNVFSRVAPGRISNNGASTRLPDNTNVGGYFGRLDINLSPHAANRSDVKVRFRHYEPNWDWWIAIDNVVVDDIAVEGGRTMVFFEDFSSKTLGKMFVDGLNTGVETWSTADKGDRYTAGQAPNDQPLIFRLMHPTPEGPNGEVEFAILESDADPDPTQDEYLMTPLLDLTGETDVFLHFKDEIVPYSNTTETVLLMQDTGDGLPDAGDTILKTILNYAGGGLWEDEEPYYHERVFSVPEAAGLDKVFFAFCYQGGNSWWWAVDDVRVTVGVMNLTLAYNPKPSNRAQDTSRNVVLSWTPGEYVTGLSPKHRVFLSDDFNDVNDGIGGITQDPNYYPTDGSLALDFGKVYYWRMDEANSVTGWDQGDIWQFTTEPVGYPILPKLIKATASSWNSEDMRPEKTIDGSGLNDNDQHSTDDKTMWLSKADGPQPTWIQYEFDKVYKLHEMLVWNYNMQFEYIAGFGLQDVKIEYSVNNSDWDVLSGVPQFTKATGQGVYVHDTPVDFKGVLAKYVKITAISNWGDSNQYGLSEVRFTYIPVWPREPNPDDEAINVEPDVVISWRAGREAETHNLYFSSNRKAVINGTVPAIPLTEARYDAGALELDKIYYWKVNEVNEFEIPMTWEGDVWQFATPEYFVVDDMESYGDADTPGPPPPPGSNIWYTWTDGEGWTGPPPGYGGNGTGSVVGLSTDPAINRQSLACSYDNDGTNSLGSSGKQYYSEGGPDNSITEQMYVKVNGVKVVYDDDMADIQSATWHEWNIELKDFKDEGVDLTNVTKIALGFGDETSAIPGGSGVVYFDNIRLYPSRCVLSRRSADLAKVDYVEDCVVNYKELELMSEKWFVTAAAPSSGNLVGHWKFDGNANDSSTRGTHGTIAGEALWVAGRIDSALELDGRTHVVLSSGTDLNFGDATDFSIALWIKTTGWQDDAALISNKDWMSGGNTGWVIAGQGGGSGTWQWNYSGETGGRQDYDPPGPTLSDGQWHHLCVVHDRDGNATFYFDGEYQAQVDIAGSTGTIDSGYPTVIGQDGTEMYSNGWFEGVIDDVRFYNSVLTQENVLYLTDMSTDLNDDNRVDLKDFAILGDTWLDEQLWP
ncbi:MAG: LamG-like jellyroll fold domain-containing protein [Planctomycetota bacterium]